MSTVAGRRQRSVHAQPHLESLAPRKRRLRWVVLASLGSLLLLGWWAPAIVARTPLRDMILNWCLADLQGHVTSGGASLGWLSPITAYDVSVVDNLGQPVLEVPTLSSDKTLLSLALQQGDLGRFRFEMPQLHLALRADGSNVEDVIATWLAPSDEPSSDGMAIALEFIDGSILLADKTNGLQWQIRDLKAVLKVPGRAADPFHVSVSGTISQPSGLGSFAAALTQHEMATESGRAASAGQITLTTKQFPLAAVQSLLRRTCPDSQISGELASDLSYQWGVDEKDANTWSLDGRANARQLVFSGPLLAGDQLRLEQCDLVAKLAEQANQLRVDTLTLNCDAGQLVCRGVLPDAQNVFAASSVAQLFASLKSATAEISSQLDLARLAVLLPHTFRLRDELQITAGTLAAQLASRSDQGHASWQGNLETSRLVALHEGRELTWDQPLKVTLAARDSDRGLVIDSLQCLANFAQLEGAGNADLFQLTGTCDLDRLTAEAGRFVNLQGLQLVGKGSIRAGWKRADDGDFQAGAELQLVGFEFTQPGNEPWKEQQLTITATATGHEAGQNFSGTIDTANLTLTSGSDQLAARVQGPINDLSAAATWPIEVQMRGNIVTWLSRLKPWFTLPSVWQLAGEAELVASAQLSPSALDVSSSKLVAKSFQLRGPGLMIQEPEVTVDAKAHWSSSTGQLRLPEVRFVSATISGDAHDVVLGGTDPTLPALSGNTSLTGDVHRMLGWINPAILTDWNITGRLNTQAAIEQSAGKTTARLDANVENLIATPRTGQAWQEPRMQLSLAGDYDRATDALRLERFDTQSELLQVQAAGRVEQLSTAKQLQLSGQLDYDLNKLSRVLQSTLGGNVQLAGRESGTFSLAGPISPGQAARGGNAPIRALAPGQQFTGKAELGWQWANLYGFEIGRGKLNAELADGLVRIAPIDMAVSNGRLHLAPQIRLAPGPMELLLPAGPLAEQIQITPQMCARGLAYIAPVLAGVAQAQGKFSVALEGGRIPLANPTQGDVSGRLTVHSVDIAPGPMIQELATLSGHGGVAQLKRESEVSFRMVQGRIYHQGLELVFPDLTIRTHGSVGLDQTLAVLAEMPVPPKWIGNNPVGDALKGQTIQLPIGGTLQRPQLDRKVMDQAAAQFIRKAGENVIRNELDKQLEKVLPPGLGPLFQQPR